MDALLKTGQEYLRASELACHLRLSRRTVFRYVRAGLLPRPMKPNSRVSLFRVSEVRQFVAAWREGREAPGG